MRTSSALLQVIPAIGPAATLPPASPVAFIGVIFASYPQLATLVSPKHIVLSRHYTKKVKGSRIVFAKSQYELIEAKVLGEVLHGEGGGADLTVYELDREVDVVPAQIATKQEIVKTNRFFASGVRGPTTRSPSAVLVPAMLKSVSGALAVFRQTVDSTIENGDSGAGDFVEVNGVNKLVGPHYAILPNEWRTTIAAPYAAAISALS